VDYWLLMSNSEGTEYYILELDLQRFLLVLVEQMHVVGEKQNRNSCQG
jgi:hypothetical protein